VPVYQALGLEWDPRTAGAVGEEAPGVATDDVAEALLAEYRRDHELEDWELDPATLALARRYAGEHLAPGERE
jgi:octanoyl-[GcvH]:protein N-octanoyltransferase